MLRAREPAPVAAALLRGLWGGSCLLQDRKLCTVMQVRSLLTVMSLIARDRPTGASAVY